ncbi:hypothetical protein ACFRNT_18610 [Streptomyces sp. NPDC056697]|uniref:hypothetical protein n=1 Tax=Streptomyces sp. NPDC056697 TaxID=3345915 RepID=UPI0036748CA3
MRDARSQRAANKGELVLTEQERALLAEIAAMADRLRVELEDVRAEVTELKRSSRGEGSK